MSRIETGTRVQPRCLCCGAALGTRQPMPADDHRLCERCFLDQTEVPSGATDSSAPAQFAEALAEALDLREHETRRRSRRVACHTQALARRFSDEADFLPHLSLLYATPTNFRRRCEISSKNGVDNF